MWSYLFPEPLGQGLLQFAELGLALVLSALIGLEREIRQKSAGLRTYTLVGLASALIMLVSKYGFTDLLAPGLAAHLAPWIQLPTIIGEGSLCLWLLIAGVDTWRWAQQARAANRMPYVATEEQIGRAHV